MGIHVDELHTDVVTAPASASDAHIVRGQAPSPGAAEERWAELRRTAEGLGLRTASEGFDD
jgi:hypothetical protein